MCQIPTGKLNQIADNFIMQLIMHLITLLITRRYPIAPMLYLADVDSGLPQSHIWDLDGTSFWELRAIIIVSLQSHRPGL